VDALDLHFSVLCWTLMAFNLHDLRSTTGSGLPQDNFTIGELLCNALALFHNCGMYHNGVRMPLSASFL